jgi:hypothetical protein
VWERETKRVGRERVRGRWERWKGGKEKEGERGVVVGEREIRGGREGGNKSII